VIEVTGIDGRVHSFADGTTQAQIDAALEGIYGAPADTPYSGPWRNTGHQLGQRSRAPNMVLILGTALAAAVIALLAVVVFKIGGNGPAPTADQSPKADGVAVLPSDQIPTNQVPGTTHVLTTQGVTPEAFAGFVTTQQGGNVTVRSQTQLTATQVAKLPHGAPISVTGSIVMPDGLWRQVNIGGTTGYIKGEYVSQTQPVAVAKAPVAAAKMIPREFWAIAVTKSSNTVNMRSSPSTTAAISGSIPAGSDVYVIGEQGAWYLVEFKGKRGWTNSSYISRDEYD
jgi:uncharacterized protein YraI